MMTLQIKLLKIDTFVNLSSVRLGLSSINIVMDFVQRMKRALQRGRSVTLPSGQCSIGRNGKY